MTLIIAFTNTLMLKKTHKLPPEAKCLFLANLFNGLDKVSMLKP